MLNFTKSFSKSFLTLAEKHESVVLEVFHTKEDDFLHFSMKNIQFNWTLHRGSDVNKANS